MKKQLYFPLVPYIFRLLINPLFLTQKQFAVYFLQTKKDLYFNEYNTSTKDTGAMNRDGNNNIRPGFIFYTYTGL